MQEKGTISVNTENIFPIIKKFLYSDQEVFLRELVANAVDATQKLRQLAIMGVYEGDPSDAKIDLKINKNFKTITVSDQGIGMTAEEIKKYINQVAFSGATAFLSQYKDQQQSHELIGFFGLGFYAAFMVASRVEIITKSYKKDQEAVHWTCEGTTQFEISPSVKKSVGTDVILHITEDAVEFLKKDKIKQLLDKYCKFMPVPITFEGDIINDSSPLWTQPPSELTDKDYITFYKKLYSFAPDPLFWIHLNVDYPFHLTGILYFPKLTDAEFVQHQNQIKLYAKQVFITDEVKHVVPEFLSLLHGVIDSPDIPLNVSRSALQADGNVKKINTYITKKVATTLETLFKQDRRAYEEKWSSIAFFIKYGMLTDEKFYDKAAEFVLLHNTSKQHFTLQAYKDHVAPQQTDKHGNVVFLYTTSPQKQHSHIQASAKQSYDVLVLDHTIDQHFIGLLERKLEKVSFKGVDTAPLAQLIEKDSVQEHKLTEAQEAKVKALYEKAITTHQVTWKVAAMAIEEPPVSIVIPEFAKRMSTMRERRIAQEDAVPVQAVINTNHPLTQRLLRSKKEEKQLQLAQQVYSLALLAQDKLHGSELTVFMKNTIDMLSEV